MIINHNLPALDAHRNMAINTFKSDRNLESLSSGLRINRAADDAAGLAVSEKMRSQIPGLNQASRNAQDTISFLQTAEGWLSETTSAVQRVRELAVQAASGIYHSEDREFIQTEVNNLVNEIQRISEDAEFNRLSPLAGHFGNPTAPNATVAPQDPNVAQLNDGLVAHIGANMDQFERLYIENMSAKALGLAEDTADPGTVIKVDVTTVETANQAISMADEALKQVTGQRSQIGAYMNRMEMAVQGINNASENLQAAESRIRDTDMATEMVDFVKNSILTQSSANMLSQANLRPQIVLRVLG